MALFFFFEELVEPHKLQFFFFFLNLIFFFWFDLPNPEKLESVRFSRRTRPSISIFPRVARS